MGSLLRKHGLPQRLSEALCAELGLEARRCAPLISAVFPMCLSFCVKWPRRRKKGVARQEKHSNEYLGRQAGPLEREPCYSTCLSSLCWSILSDRRV